MEIYLNRIAIFPVKALDGIVVEETCITAGGALEYDRRFALFDRDGRVISGKRHPEVNQLAARFDLEEGRITLDIPGFDAAESFDLEPGNKALDEWFSDFLGFPVTLREDRIHGFPDDTVRSGPTLISTPTLERIATWFPHLELDNLRRRFRTNLEIGGETAFWEEDLLRAEDVPRRIRIGAVDLELLKICSRCPVPTEDPDTGEVDTGFQATFMRERSALLAPDAPRKLAGQFYTVALNTRLPPAMTGTCLHQGDPVSV